MVQYSSCKTLLKRYMDYQAMRWVDCSWYFNSNALHKTNSCRNKVMDWNFQPTLSKSSFEYQLLSQHKCLQTAGDGTGSCEGPVHTQGRKQMVEWRLHPRMPHSCRREFVFILTLTVDVTWMQICIRDWKIFIWDCSWARLICSDS